MPIISVIIPVYNAEQYLERCLESIINQTLKNIEIICVDDCSKDKSLEILNEYALKDKRIKVIHCNKNGGESKARNIGLDNSTGKYLSFVDNDDYLDLDFYEKLYSKAESSNADIVRGEVRIYDYKGKIRYNDLNPLIRKNNSKLYFMYFWWTAIYSAKLIKNNNIRFLEGYPLGGDVLFLNESIIKSDKLELVDNVYYNYVRRVDSGDSLVLSQEKVKSILEILEKIADNTLDYKTEDKKGVEMICNWIFNSIIEYAFRLKTVENLRICIDALFIVYNKIKSKADVNYLNLFLVIKDYLDNNDKEGLFNFYLKNDSIPKIMIANLRYSHLKKRSEV